MATYMIRRFFRDGDKNPIVIKRGLTLEQAQEYCNDPETSSSTAQSPQAKEYTAKYGPWFDGYDEE